MRATLPGCEARWRSRQLYDALSSPSWNHLKKGALDSSSTLVKGFDHLSSWRACFAQKPSKPLSASAHIALYTPIPAMLACFAKPSGGGKVRDCSGTDSMVDMRAPPVDREFY